MLVADSKSDNVQKLKILLKIICLLLTFLPSGEISGEKTGSLIPTKSISGYIQFWFKYNFDEETVPENEFQIPRARVRFKNTITGRLQTVIEIDGGRGRFSFKDIGIEWQFYRWLGFNIGQQKIPFSREELRSASKLLVIDRGEVNDAFGNNGYLGRDIGVSVNGEVIKDRTPIAYSLGIFNGNGANLAGDNDNTKQFAERITAGPLHNLAFGLNSTQRSDSITHDPLIAYGGDLSFQKWGLTLEAEILSGDTEIDKGMVGGYLTVLYRIGCWEPGLKVERFYPDEQKTGDYLDTYTLNLGWYFYRNLSFKTNFIGKHRPDQDYNFRIITQIQA
ncbi:MAG: porin [candidate division WOR-3 bacterium]